MCSAVLDTWFYIGASLRDIVRVVRVRISAEDRQAYLGAMAWLRTRHMQWIYGNGSNQGIPEYGDAAADEGGGAGVGGSARPVDEAAACTTSNHQHDGPQRASPTPALPTSSASTNGIPNFTAAELGIVNDIHHAQVQSPSLESVNHSGKGSQG